MMKSQKVVLLIQASPLECSGTPAIALRPLNGKPIIYWVIEKLKQITSPSQIVAAVPDIPESKAFSNIAQETSVRIYLGSFENVLERLIGAIELADGEIFAKEQYFIDIDLLKKMIAFLIVNKLDHVQAPDGFDVHLSRHIDPEFDNYFGTKSIKNLDHDTRAQSEGRWFNGLNYGDDTTHLITMRKAFEHADLLMIGAGPMLTDITLDVFRGYLPYNALLCVLAKFFSVPVMLYGVEVVPFATEEGAKYAKFVCDNSDAICVREGRSKEILTSIGIPSNRIEVLPDPAMALSLTGDISRGKQLLRKYNVNTEQPLVGVVARHVYWMWDENDTNNYVKMMAKLCDWIIEKFDAHIVFFPHCTYGVDRILEDDREMERVIQSKMQSGDSTSLIEK